MMKSLFWLILLILIVVPRNGVAAAKNHNEPKKVQKDSDSVSRQDQELIDPESSDQKTIDFMDEKIDNLTRYPWFSGEDRKVRFLPPEKSKNTKRTVQKNPQNTTGLLPVIWIVIIIIFLAMLGILIWFVFKRIQKRHLFSDSFPKNEDEENRRRLENLPVEAQKNLNELDLLAEQAYRAGDFRKAIIYYFSFMLVELDRNRRIRLRKGKTNHDYHREIRAFRSLADIYQKTMDLFEKTYYGTWKISKEEIDTVRNDQSGFQSELQKIREEEIQRRSRSSFPMIILTILSTLILLSGCNKNWNEKYTVYIPKSNTQSMNGIELFRELCIEKGHHVKYFWRFPVPQATGDFDTIVWFYDSWNYLDSPSPEFAKDIEKWISARNGRTLVLIDNSYRANVPYWEKIIQIAPDEHRSWAEEQLINAKTSEKGQIVNLIPERNKRDESVKKEKNKNKHSGPEGSNSDTADPLWFKFTALNKVKSGSSLEGESYWTRGIDPIEPFRFCRNLEPLKGTKTVLAVNGMPLIAERKIGSGQIYIIQSGSFLMNYPLLQKDKQLLASRLIDRFGSEGKQIYIQYGPFLRLNEKEIKKVVLPFYLRATPFAVLFWHLVLLSILITFWKFPIFGRPKVLPAEKNVDFGKHLSAYGDLVAKTGNRKWVNKQIEQFKQNYQKEDPS